MAEPLTESARLPSPVWNITAVAVLGSLLSQIDATVVNVSLSSLATELHSNLAIIQWVTSGYLFALALVLPLNAWLVHRIGAKSLYLWCFAAFTICSALCGLAWSANALILFRILQGMSGGLLAPMAQLMMARAGGKNMARLMGYAALPILAGPILGPVLAGLILQHASWRWLFFVNLPVGLLAIILALLFLPNDRTEVAPRAFDFVGFALLSPGLVLFLYGADHVREPLGLGCLAVALAFLAVFVVSAHRKGDRALVNLGLFKRRVFPISAITQFLQNGIVFASQMVIPFFLIRACGRTPGATGWLLAPLGLGMLCIYPSLGALTQRFGIRRVSVAGALLSLISTVPFLYLTTHGLIIGLLELALFFRGFGQGAIGIPSITAAYASVKAQDLPMAATTLNIAQRLGGPTLTTICATFLAWRLNATSPSATRPSAFMATFVLLCGLHALLLFAALRLPVTIENAAELRGEDQMAGVPKTVPADS